MEWATREGLPCAVLPSPRRGRLGVLNEARCIARAARRVDAAILHANSPSSYRAASLTGLFGRVRRVCHLHLPAVPGELAWCFRFGPEAVVTCYSKLADEVRDELSRIRPSARLVAIPNAVDTDAFDPSPAPGDASFRFGADHVVLIIGHLSEVKGYSTFLRAAAAIRARVPSVAFVSIGGETIDVGARHRYEALAASLGLGASMHFLGWRPEVASIIRASDVVVLPSTLEGLPLSVVEAMSCARAVIATPVNGTPEAVVDGVNGLLVPPEDVEALSAAMVSILEAPDRAAEMGREGRRRALDQFSLRAQVRQVQALYTDLLNARATA